MGALDREIRSALTKAGIGNITDMTGGGPTWTLACEPGLLHVRTGSLDAHTAWSRLGELSRLSQPYLAPVVGSLELSSGEVAVISLSDDGRTLTDLINWGRQLSLGESVTVLSAIARAAAAIQGAVGNAGAVQTARCRVLASGQVQLMDPAAGLLSAGTTWARMSVPGEIQAEMRAERGPGGAGGLRDIAVELGHPRLEAVISEYAPAGFGAIARALEDLQAPEPVLSTKVPRLPGPRATRQQRLMLEPSAPVADRRSVPNELRW